MSNLSKPPVNKVVPYCQDPMSSCGLFAWGQNTGKAPAGTIFKPMFFSGKNSNRGSVYKKKCPDGYEESVVGGKLSCLRVKSNKEFSGFLGGIFGGDKEENENLADDNIGQMPDEVVGGGKGKISSDKILSGLESATELVGLLGGQRQLSEVEGACGKQPKGILRSKAVKQAWANCASAYMEAKLAEANKASSKGMSAGAWAGIALGSALLIGGGIYLATKQKGKKQVIMTQLSPVK